MKLRFSFVPALALALAVTATGPRASAQSRATNLYNNGYQLAAHAAPAGEEQLPPSRMSGPANVQGQAGAQAGAQSGQDMSYMSSGYAQGGYGDGYYGSGCCDSNCCD